MCVRVALPLCVRLDGAGNYEGGFSSASNNKKKNKKNKKKGGKKR